MGVQVFRVIVRGQFDGLDDDGRAQLRAGLDDVDPAASLFTVDGTLGYDKRLDFFAFRIEIRVQVDEDAGDATQEAFDEATLRLLQHLDARGLGCKRLKPTGVNMASMWR